ncbi:MAG: PqqD family peptide modification chaperone [Acidobacteriota bacterium]|nr:PqqD family peptide modification chaperone [Acidobacteriota bacterium]
MSSRRYRIDPQLPAPAVRTLGRLLDGADWQPTGGDDWQLFWGTTAPAAPRVDDGTPPPVRVANPVPDPTVVAWKSRLRRCGDAARERVRLLGGPDAGFVPPSFTLPEELDALKLHAALAPETPWIRRPKALSLGEGSTLLASVNALTRDPRWLVQEYVADPHLLDGRKYTLRLYVLVASLDPLRVSLHRDGRVMLAAEPYGDGADLASAPDRYRTTRETPELDLARYRERLQEERLDAAWLWTGLEWMFAATMAAARDAMLADSRDSGSGAVPAAGSFMLLECDVLVDRSLKPWLLDCRPWPAPDQSPSADGLPAEPLMTTLLRDTLVRVGVLDGNVSGGSDGFVTLLPSADPALLALLPARRPADVRLARAAAAEAGAHPVIVPHDTLHAFLDDSLVLYSERTRQLYTLNPTGSFIWLRCAEGTALPEVAAELGEVFPDNREAVAQDTWTMAADWLAQGLMRTSTAAPPPPARLRPASGQPYRRWVWNRHERIYRYLGWRVCLHAPGDLQDAALHATLSHFESPDDAEYDAALEVAVTRHGYEIRRDGVVVAGPVPAWQLAAAVHQEIVAGAYEWPGGLIALRATLVSRGGAGALLLDAPVDERTGLSGALARAGFDVRVRELLLFRRDPLRLVHRDDPATALGLRALIVPEIALEGSSRIVPLSRAVALQALLGEDPDHVATFDADGARAFVSFVGGLTCRLLTVADVRDAVELVEEAIDEGDRR